MVWISLDQELLDTVLHFLSYPDPSTRGSPNLCPTPRKVGLTSLSPINKVSWIGPCDWQLTMFTLEIIAPSTALPKGLGQTSIISYHTSIICIYLYIGCELSDAQDYSLLIVAWVRGLLIWEKQLLSAYYQAGPVLGAFRWYATLTSQQLSKSSTFMNSTWTNKPARPKNLGNLTQVTQLVSGQVRIRIPTVWLLSSIIRVHSKSAEQI